MTRAMVRMAAVPFLVAALSGPARAQTQVTFLSHLQAIKVSGDWRVRYEDFGRDGAGTTDRTRFRYRLRLGAETVLPHKFTVGLRFASGTGEPVSTNQSFDNLSSQKAIWVDQLYVRWSPQTGSDGTAWVQAGRMPNPLWRPYSSDVIWDDDFAPEGFAQGGEWLVAGGNLSVFAHAMQMVADEDSKNDKGQWVFAEQVGLETKLPLSARFRVAGAYADWVRAQRDDFGQSVAQDGNRRKPPVAPATSNNTLANRFGTAAVAGQLSFWVGGLPAALEGTWAKNVQSDLEPKADEGYQAGVVLGRAKAAKSWEVAWFHKRAETDVTVADVADSDFGDGGTNREGNIFWGAYNFEEWVQCKVKYFDTETLDETFAPGPKDVRRLQGDVTFKF